MIIVRAKGRKQGRFVALSGLKKLRPPPGSSFPLLIIDSAGQQVFFLCEWYRLQKERDPGRTPDTYLDMLLPWAGFLLRHGYAWNDPPDRVQCYLAEFLRKDVACIVAPGGKGEDAWFVETTGDSPLAKSSLGVLLAALTNVYDTLISAGYYAYPNPLRSQRMVALKREHIRQVKNAGAPDDAGIRGESWQETNRAFPTNRFRQRRGKVWEPEVVLEPDAVHQRMRSTIDFMVKHATFQRDQVILLLIRQTGARLSEAIEMTVGGYRNARHAGQALIKNKGGRGREEKTIYFTQNLDRYLLDYIRTERAKYDPHGRKRLEDLADHDPLFLTRTGKPYSRSAFYHHWNKLFAPAQQQFKKRERVEFTAHDLRHLHVKRNVTNLRQQAQGDRAVEAELLQGFHHVMGWRSPQTMEIYLKTMNKRKAIEALLADQEQQEKQEREMQESMSQRPVEGLTQARSQPQDFPGQGTPLPAHADEFSWYEHDE